MIFDFETILYEVSAVFLLPALTAILVSLAYSLLTLGRFLMELVQRYSGRKQGALTQYYRKTGADSDDLELWIMKRLEPLRLVSRVAPLLGLVATLIPMGPALMALTSGESAEMASNLVVAFSGVTLALIAASLAFFVLNIRRRWLLEELRVIETGAEVVS
nr:MotA/TolQ/ExbB proton channel family protein [uncultured Hyphomonas sp.]